LELCPWPLLVGSEPEFALEGQRELVCVVVVPLGPTLTRADPETAGLPEVHATRGGAVPSRPARFRQGFGRDVEVLVSHAFLHPSQPLRSSPGGSSPEEFGCSFN